MTAPKPVPCPLLPEVEPRLVTVGAFWNVEVESANGLWVVGPSWMDKARAIREWNELMTNYPGANP